jgi:hypothetical protein
MLHGTTAIPGSFAATYDRAAERTISPSWWARTLAWVGARWFDRQLAAGADPARSPMLAARACRLASDENRASLAAALERLMINAEVPANHWSVAPHRRAIMFTAADLTDLAALLRDRGPLYVRGLAMLGRVVSDGTGPAYVGGPDALSRQLREARRALAG